VKVTVIGCSGSFAGPTSPASSYLVQADDADGRTWNLLLDLGSGALGPLQQHIDLPDLSAVALSHLHPDHCADVCGLYVTRKYHPTATYAGRLPVWGPRDAADRIALAYHGLGEEGMGAEFDFRGLADGVSFDVGPMTVTPFRVNHPVEAYGFRVEAGGVVVAYTGDTDSTPALTPLLAGADLALVDCAFVDGRDETRDIHLTGSRAALAAVGAGGVKRFVLTHLPAWNDPDVCRAQAAAIWPGEVEVATAGTAYDL